MSDSVGYKPNIEELEMLLEAYFVQIEGTLNKLSTVSPLFMSISNKIPTARNNLGI